uniref:DNA-directed RNA polymerase RpoA/D/Rpb3-type domain-containing protein n=1 Tax=Gossypium raimondii TaxID=29730 RepID=A0A0D2RW95_GOSRA|nr:hypothetical protein B456_006G029900 [Gossypium raimondii]
MAEGAGEEKKKFSIWDLPVPMGQLPPHLELQRSRVSCNKDAPIHTESIQYSGAYASMGIDNSSRLDRFSNNFRVEVVRLNEDDMEFDMIACYHMLAMLACSTLSLPTMAIEKVLIANNTSIIQDEVLAHRLGLVPIRVDPRLFDYLSENDQRNEKNTIGIETPCSEIELEAHAAKGIGKTHAKWSPVAIAWYRMLPEVVLLEDIEYDLAEELKSKCPVNVFDIEDLGKGRRRATVARPRACTLCRECIRGDDWEKRVALRRVKDHFICK